MDKEPFTEQKYKGAIDPVARRIDGNKWDNARGMTLGGAGLSTALLFLITQIGLKSLALSVSFFCASLAIPAWLALWQVGEAYSFYGSASTGHFATRRGSGAGILLFLVGGLLLLTAFTCLIWHFSVPSSIAFLLGCIGMVAFVFGHQVSVRKWADRSTGHDA